MTQVTGQLPDAGVQADPGSLTCPDALAPRVGETARCSFTSDGQSVDLVARAAAVDGTKVDLELTTEARPVPKATLEEAVAQRVGLDLTADLTSTTCDGDLKPATGSSTTCTLTSGTEERTVRVAVPPSVGARSLTASRATDPRRPRPRRCGGAGAGGGSLGIRGELLRRVPCNAGPGRA